VCIYQHHGLHLGKHTKLIKPRILNDFDIYWHNSLKWNSRILNWGYCTIFQAIFCGDIPLHSPYIGLIYPYIWQVPPINRFLTWPLIEVEWTSICQCFYWRSKIIFPRLFHGVHMCSPAVYSPEIKIYHNHGGLYNCNGDKTGMYGLSTRENDETKKIIYYDYSFVFTIYVSS